MGGRILASTAAPNGVVVSPSLGSRPRSLRPFHLQRPPFDPRLPLVLVGTESQSPALAGFARVLGTPLGVRRRGWRSLRDNREFDDAFPGGRSTPLPFRG
jgi:hypothetical protein